MKFLLFILMAAAFCAACSLPVEKNINWVGHKKSELIQTLGPPSRIDKWYFNGLSLIYITEADTENAGPIRTNGLVLFDSTRHKRLHEKCRIFHVDSNDVISGDWYRENTNDLNAN